MPDSLLRRLGLAIWCWTVVIPAVAPSCFSQTPEVLWYRFDEGGGTTCANGAVPGAGAASATLTGHQLVPGIGCAGSGALRGFAGFTNYVDTGWAPNLPAGSGWAIGFFFDWSVVDLPAGSYIVLGTALNQTAGVFCELQWDPVNPRLELKRTDNGFYANTLNLPVAGRHHVVWNYEATSGLVRIYLDGVAIQTGFLPLANPGLLASGILRVGSRGTTFSIELGMPFDMIMDDFRVYSHTLSQAEISAWYATGSTWTPFVPPPPPANDACASATPLAIGLNGPFTTKYATPTPGYPSGCDAVPLAKDVWFTFTPPASGDYAFNTCSPVSPIAYDQHVDTRLSVHTGLCGATSVISGGCSTHCSQAWIGAGSELATVGAISMTAGTTYHLRVADAYPYYRGRFWLTVIPPPLNDACSAAVPLPVNGSASGDNSTAGAAASVPAPPCVSSTSRDVWYSFTYPGPTGGGCGQVTTTLSLCGSASNMDSVLAVWSGTCGSLVSVACNDDGCLPASHESVLSFNPAIGVTYLVSVSRFGVGGQGAPFTLHVTTQAGAAQSLGAGCGSNPAPVLSSNFPSIGTQFNLQLANGGANLSGFLIAADALGGPFVIPGGCAVTLDLTTYDLIPLTTNASGSWLFTLAIPNDPMLICAGKKVQAAIYNGGPGTWRTSQALSLTIGP